MNIYTKEQVKLLTRIEETNERLQKCRKARVRRRIEELEQEKQLKQEFYNDYV